MGRAKMKIVAQTTLEEDEKPDTFRRCANIPMSSISDVMLPIIPMMPKEMETSSPGSD
jgi:hypothetical protein